MEDKEIKLEEEKVEEELVEEPSKEEQEEQIEEPAEEVSEYEAKLNEYQYQLEEALINIEAKENIALNSESEEDIEAYKQAKIDYENLRKEFNKYKKENAPRTWWNTLPLRMKIFSFVNIVFCFPYLAWEVFHFWYYPLKWTLKIFGDGLIKLYDKGAVFPFYLIVGFAWFFVSLILIAFNIVMFEKRKKEDINPDYKKTYMGFVIGNAVLTLSLVAYQVIIFVTEWF